MRRFLSLGILLIAILVIVWDIGYTRTQLASGGSGEERLDSWILPASTLVFFGASLAAVNRAGWLRIVALVAAACSLASALLGYVLVTRW